MLVHGAGTSFHDITSKFPKSRQIWAWPGPGRVNFDRSSIIIFGTVKNLNQAYFDQNKSPITWKNRLRIVWELALETFAPFSCRRLCSRNQSDSFWHVYVPICLCKRTPSAQTDVGQRWSSRQSRFSLVNFSCTAQKSTLILLGPRHGLASNSCQGKSF